MRPRRGFGNFWLSGATLDGSPGSEVQESHGAGSAHPHRGLSSKLFARDRDTLVI